MSVPSPANRAARWLHHAGRFTSPQGRLTLTLTLSGDDRPAEQFRKMSHQLQCNQPSRSLQRSGGGNRC
jgi:hypothetical protein